MCFSVWCGGGGTLGGGLRLGVRARPRDGATFRRGGAARCAAGTRRPWEKSKSFYVVAEVADNDTEVPHPGFPLPAVGT